MTYYERIDRKGASISELAEKTGLSRRTIARHTSRTRAEWIRETAAQRQEIRAYHDDEGHSWTETARHFNLSLSTVKQRAYRARRELTDAPTVEEGLESRDLLAEATGRPA